MYMKEKNFIFNLPFDRKFYLLNCIISLKCYHPTIICKFSAYTIRYIIFFQLKKKNMIHNKSLYKWQPEYPDGVNEVI